MNRFDAMARDFDTDERVARANVIAARLREHILGGAHKTAIEYGCGTGLVGLALADCFAALTLADSSEEMLRKAEQKLAAPQFSHVSTLRCDIMEDIPPELRADCVLLSLVLHHIHDTAAALRRLCDMVNDGGRLFVVDLDEEDGSFHAQYPDFNGHNGFARPALLNLAREAGFSAARAETFFIGSKAVHGVEHRHTMFLLEAAK